MNNRKWQQLGDWALRVLARAVWSADFRGKSRLISLLPMKKRAVFSLPWTKIELALDDRIQRQMAFGAYERREVRIVRTHVGLGDVAIDVGAHVGYYTLLLARQVGPLGRVIAVEPFRENFEMLERNLVLNTVPWVETVFSAASDIDELGRIFPPDRAGESGLPTLARRDGRRGTAVPCRRLDHILGEKGIRHVDFIKIDAEGWEPKVLEGLGSYLEGPNAPTILAEISDRLLSDAGHRRADVVEYLMALGYQRIGIPGRAGQERHNSLFLKER